MEELHAWACIVDDGWKRRRRRLGGGFLSDPGVFYCLPWTPYVLLGVTAPTRRTRRVFSRGCRSGELSLARGRCSNGRCRRGVDNAWCRFGGPQAETILSREGVHNPEKNCFVSGKAGHCARASPAGLGDPSRTRPFTPRNGATTPSFTRDLCS